MDSVEDEDDNDESSAEYREGGLNWHGAFKGGIVSGITHVLKSTASKPTMLLAFKMLFNMIEHSEVPCPLFSATKHSFYDL